MWAKCAQDLLWLDGAVLVSQMSRFSSCRPIAKRLFFNLTLGHLRLPKKMPVLGRLKPGFEGRYCPKLVPVWCLELLETFPRLFGQKYVGG
jgi:hypothetical protein